MYDHEFIQKDGSSLHDSYSELSMDSHLWGYLQPCNSLVARIDFWRTQPNYVLGRNPNNHVILTGSRISNHHCDISWDGSEARDSVVTVTDRSSNGTYINGMKLGKGITMILREGNELSLATVSAHLDPAQDFRFIYRHLAGGQPTTGLYASYDLSHELGKGAYATVMKAVSRSTGKFYAVKIINANKHLHSSGATRTFQREIDIMKELQHENIVQLKESFVTDTHIELVLELVEGGDLLSYILDRGGLSEPSTRHITYQMCRALSYIHGKGITHRDLKPENVLVTKDEPPIVKIADFGLAKIVNSETMLRTMCGTPAYLAPEIVTQKLGEGYTNKVDSWSVGVIVFSMLTNSSPFIEDTTHDFQVRILSRHVDWSLLKNIEPPASKQCQNFIQGLLENNPKVRLSVTDSFNHLWLSTFNPCSYATNPSEISSIDSQDFSMLTEMPGFDPDVSFDTNINGILAVGQVTPRGNGVGGRGNDASGSGSGSGSGSRRNGAGPSNSNPPYTHSHPNPNMNLTFPKSKLKLKPKPIQRRAHVLSKVEHENLNIPEPSKEMYENSKSLSLLSRIGERVDWETDYVGYDSESESELESESESGSGPLLYRIGERVRSEVGLGMGMGSMGLGMGTMGLVASGDSISSVGTRYTQTSTNTSSASIGKGKKRVRMEVSPDLSDDELQYNYDDEEKEEDDDDDEADRMEVELELEVGSELDDDEVVVGGMNSRSRVTTRSKTRTTRQRQRKQSGSGGGSSSVNGEGFGGQVMNGNGNGTGTRRNVPRKKMPRRR